MDKPTHIEVEAIRGFRANGDTFEAGNRVVLDLEDALTVISIGRARAVGEAAHRVGMRSHVEWSEPTREQTRGSRYSVWGTAA